jgi:acylphosphatase
MKQSVILTIQGHVQGVGFRYFVKQKADLLQITGFVKNKINGEVHVEAEGEPEQLQLFVNYCKQGPSHAHVTDVAVQYCPVQDFQGFEKR